MRRKKSATTDSSRRLLHRLTSSVSGLTVLVLIANGCASAPSVTEATKRVASNPRAIVEGVVRDETGRAVAGIGVRGVPRGKDIPWAPPVTTDCAGRFRLPLPAPAGYAFQLYWKGRSVATDDPADPLLVDVVVQPGEERNGLDLTLLRARWESVTGESPGDPAACGAASGAR